MASEQPSVTDILREMVKLWLANPELARRSEDLSLDTTLIRQAVRRKPVLEPNEWTVYRVCRRSAPKELAVLRRGAEWRVLGAWPGPSLGPPERVTVVVAGADEYTFDVYADEKWEELAREAAEAASRLQVVHASACDARLHMSASGLSVGCRCDRFRAAVTRKAPTKQKAARLELPRPLAAQRPAIHSPVFGAATHHPAALVPQRS